MKINLSEVLELSTKRNKQKNTIGMFLSHFCDWQISICQSLTNSYQYDLRKQITQTPLEIVIRGIFHQTEPVSRH